MSTISARVPASPGHGRSEDWLLNQLPAAMASEDFFARFVRIFQAQGSTLLAHADNLPHLADPTLAPVELIRWMTGWLGSPGVDPTYPEEVQRAVLRTASETLQWRGTSSGITRVLELMAEGPVHVRESGGVWAEGVAPDVEPWVALEVAGPGLLEVDDLVRHVLDEVPAHVHVEITVAGQVVWPPAASAAPHSRAEHDDEDGA